MEDKSAVDVAKSDSALERGNSSISKSDGELYELVELNQERFSVWSVIGLQFSCSAAPLAICSFTYLVVGVGGTSYFVWCYLVAVIGQLIMIASLAEISAIYPHASGTYRDNITLIPHAFKCRSLYLTFDLHFL